MTAWLRDTAPLVAFFDRSDAGHEWAKEKWAQAPVPMLTCVKGSVRYHVLFPPGPVRPSECAGSHWLVRDKGHGGES